MIIVRIMIMRMTITIIVIIVTIIAVIIMQIICKELSPIYSAQIVSALSKNYR